MDYFADITKNNIDDYLEKYFVIICRLRNSRIKAKQTAIFEMVFSQLDNGIIYIKNGPLGDIKGIISFFCPKQNLNKFKSRLYGIGYCDYFYILNFDNANMENNTGLISINPLYWKGRPFSLNDFYIQDNEIYISQSPHNRQFKIFLKDGTIKSFTGYRGDGGDLGRRSLPVEDARCMVNLSMPHKNKKMLDPFAGGGGIIYQFGYIAPNGDMTSIDIDPVLQPGLEFYGARHYTMDSGDIVFTDKKFDSIITEVPFLLSASEKITKAFNNLDKYIDNNGITVIMCEKQQGKFIENTVKSLENFLLMNNEINRKGTDVFIQVWTKNKGLSEDMRSFSNDVKKIF